MVPASSVKLATIAGRLGSVGGTEIAQLAICQGLAERGSSVDLFYREGGDLTEAWQRCTRVMTAVGPTLPDVHDPLRSSIGVLATAKAVRAAHAEIVYVHNAGDVPVALAAAALSSTRVVTHLHVPPPVGQPAWLNRALRRVDRVIVPSHDAATRWRTVSGVDAARIDVIPTGVDTDRFVPLASDERDAVRRELGCGEGVPMVLYAGRLEANKGAHLLVEAEDLSSAPMFLVFCGTTSDAAYADQLRASLSGRDAAFLGHRRDVARLMAAADVLVLPSTVAETQGLVIAEAMACGTPVVASDVGGVADSMAHAPERLVPPGDASALARALDSVVHWRSEDPELGARSRSWVIDHLGRSRSIAAVAELLDSV